MPPPLAASSCAFEFAPALPMEEVEGTFQLALLATEALYGADRVALEAVYKVDADSRTIEIDRSTGVGGTLALVFLGYARREFSQDAFRMRRVHGGQAAATGEVAQ